MKLLNLLNRIFGRDKPNNIIDDRDRRQVDQTLERSERAYNELNGYANFLVRRNWDQRRHGQR